MVFESMCDGFGPVNGTCYCVNGTSQCNGSATDGTIEKSVKPDLKL
jgi:hypothetical protein